MSLPADLSAHLSTGVTTLCRCWRLTRADGRVHGFTDHDGDLRFDGTLFRAGAGLSARTLEQTTGLAVDNSEALGVLSDAGVREADILAGRFDGAEVLCWRVNWADPAQRHLTFRGTLGEIERAGGAFRAELRGLTEALNQPQGRVFQAQCPAILGDGACRVDLSRPDLVLHGVVKALEDRRIVDPGPDAGFAPGWFERGRLVLTSGAGAGVVGIVKSDTRGATGRRIELWEALPEGVAAGDTLRLEAGCDKRADTCRAKFDNMVNFQGHPHLPGEDWLMAYPVRGQESDTPRSLSRDAR